MHEWFVHVVQCVDRMSKILGGAGLVSMVISFLFLSVNLSTQDIEVSFVSSSYSLLNMLCDHTVQYLHPELNYLLRLFSR